MRSSLFVVLILAWACAGPARQQKAEAKAEDAAAEPVECRFVEAGDPGSIVLHCSAIGSNANDAVARSRSGALDWVARRRLCQDPSEIQAFEKVRAEVLADLSRFVPAPSPASRGGPPRGLRSRVRMGSDRVKVEVFLEVHEEQLRRELQERKVLSGRAAGGPKLDLVAVVVPGKVLARSKHRDIVLGIVMQRLKPSGIEFVDIAHKPQSRFSAGSGCRQPICQGQDTGADLVFEVDAHKESRGDALIYTARLGVFESATARIVWTDTAVSASRFSGGPGTETKALQEVCADLAARGLPALTAYAGRLEGRPLLLVMPKAAEGLSKSVHAEMKKHCKKLRPERASGNRSLTAYCSGEVLEIVQALQASLADVEIESNGRNLILVKGK
ncbi:MAG: hypothetical protein JXR96_23445 [Deltaproteobacteria bacterium]|nr:hypothetical protein [Deltaproteobacteria bacterium]